MIYLKDILPEDKVEFWGLNTDYGVRDYAFMYIDGILHKGEVHNDMVIEYCESNELNVYIDKTQGFITEEDQEELDLPLILGSVFTDKNNNKYAVLYETCLFYCSVEDFIEQVKLDFPDHIVCVDPFDRRFEGEEHYLKIA